MVTVVAEAVETIPPVNEYCPIGADVLLMRVTEPRISDVVLTTVLNDSVNTLVFMLRLKPVKIGAVDSLTNVDTRMALPSLIPTTGKPVISLMLPAITRIYVADACLARVGWLFNRLKSDVCKTIENEGAYATVVVPLLIATLLIV